MTRSFLAVMASLIKGRLELNFFFLIFLSRNSLIVSLKTKLVFYQFYEGKTNILSIFWSKITTKKQRSARNRCFKVYIFIFEHLILSQVLPLILILLRLIVNIIFVYFYSKIKKTTIYKILKN